jgi:hypothetical protein
MKSTAACRSPIHSTCVPSGAVTVFDGDTVVGMETFDVGTAVTHDCGGPGQRRVTMQLRDP